MVSKQPFFITYGLTISKEARVSLLHPKKVSVNLFPIIYLTRETENRAVEVSPSRASQRENAGTGGEIHRKQIAFDIAESTQGRRARTITIEGEPENVDAPVIKRRKQPVSYILCL